jgi:hypothetical protein
LNERVYPDGFVGMIAQILALAMFYQPVSPA